MAAQRPSHAHPVLDLLGLLRRERLQDAYPPVLHACLSLAPSDPRLHRALAEHLHDTGDDEAALAATDAWLTFSPDDESALSQRAMILASLGQADAALARFHALATRSPGTARHWTNLGTTLRRFGRLDAALPPLRRATGLAPRDAQIRLNHATALLHAGRFDEGWRGYEARLSLPGHTLLPPARLLPTLNDLPGRPFALRGRTILCTHEEGFGDTLQFARYLPALAALGARVIAHVPTPLLRLLRTLGPTIETADSATPPPPHDWHCPMLSLPRAFATTLPTIPSATPYLHADPSATQAAAARLARALPGTPLRVGLAWAGQSRPWLPGIAAIDRRRSLPLATLAPLAALPNTALVGLQTGPAATQPGPPLHPALADSRDFADTAAVIACLDVVVSVDTAIVHLAGALGRPVLMLDRSDPCWRWLHGRDDSPWYPHLRIVRQTTPGDWTEPVARVADILRGMKKERPGALPLDPAKGSPLDGFN